MLVMVSVTVHIGARTSTVSPVTLTVHEGADMMVAPVMVMVLSMFCSIFLLDEGTTSPASKERSKTTLAAAQ
jgi:hypothetical protein